jgi:hypothetical protein
LTIVAAGIVLSSAKGGERKYVEGLMLDAATYDWCHNDCFFFDRPSFLFCVQADGQILIGSHKADWKCQYDSSQMLRHRGEQVSVRYDDRSIWMVRTDGKEMHLGRDYSQDVFAAPECSAAIHSRWLKGLEPIERPHTVPPEAVLVPHRPSRRPSPYFWITCRFDSQSLWDVCDTWDDKGRPFTRLEGVDSSTHRAVLQKDLVVDPLTTKEYFEIHLRNGVILRDWAKARINNTPTPDSRLPQPPLDSPGREPQ